MTCPILYRDRDLVVCVKPRGISSEDALPSLLSGQLDGKQVWCVHRLDTAVGGVMVYALSAKAAAKLSALIAGHELQKEYLAVVAGRPEEDAGTLRDFLFHDRAKNKSYPVKRMRAGVKEAILEYTLAEAGDTLSLLRVRLHTGRSHQIRVQFASRGMPLVGDVKYGSAYRDCPIALFSCALRFPHPFSGEPLSFSALPEEGFPWDIFQTVQSEEPHEISGSLCQYPHGAD